MKVKYKQRLVDAKRVSETHWEIQDSEVFPNCVGSFDDESFREVFENEFDTVILSPRALTEQLSQELQRWGMTPLPLDLPIEATLALTLAAVRQITFDIERVTKFAHAKDIRRELEELINC